MKKALTLFVLALAMMAMMTSFAFADSCSSKKADAKTASAKTCSPEEVAACAKAKGISAEDCAKACAEGKFVKKTVAIEGMTCGSCENSVKTTLTKIDGVQHVLSVSHKDKNAVVCFDPSKVKGESLIKAITAKGYKAQFASAKTAAVKTSDSKSCAKTCSPAEKAACDAKKKDHKEEDKDSDKGDI